MLRKATRWFVSPEDDNDPTTNFLKKTALVVSALTATFGFVVLIVQLMPGSSGDSDGFIVVDIDFAESPIDMSFNLDSLGPWDLEEVTEEDLERWRTSKTSARQVLITLANETDNPSVMTEIRVDVHEMVEIYDCGEAIGGSVVVGTLYDFKIPNEVPWSGTQTQNFVLNPRSVEAFATTVGPMYGDLTMRVFRSSISAETTSDGQVELGQIVGVDVYDPDFGYAEDYIANYRGTESYAPGVVANCATQMLGMIDGLKSQAEQSQNTVAIDPTLETIAAYYEGLIASEPRG